MANIIWIILRATTVGFLSSLSNFISRPSRTWQCSQSTPREAVMNCMAGKSWSAGRPFRTWIFLNCCSVSLGAGAVWAATDGDAMARDRSAKTEGSAHLFVNDEVMDRQLLWRREGV